jgi:hypothetical protein
MVRIGVHKNNNECPFIPSPQAKEMSNNKVSIIAFTKDIVTRSPSNKRPRTTQGPQLKWQRTLLKNMVLIHYITPFKPIQMERKL